MSDQDRRFACDRCGLRPPEWHQLRAVRLAPSRHAWLCDACLWPGATSTTTLLAKMRADLSRRRP